MFPTNFAVINFVIFTVIGIVRNEIFTAMSDVEALIDFEREVVRILRKFVKTEKKKLSAMESYIRDFADVYEDNPEKDIIGFVSHPVNAFTLVRHLGVDWSTIRNLLSADNGNALQEIERRREQISPVDVKEDLRGAAEAIARLQHTYNLEEKVIASGYIPGIRTSSPPLTSFDCYLLGYHQAELGIYDYAINWLQLALERREVEEQVGIEQKISKAIILDWLQDSEYNFGNVSGALSVARLLERIFPDFSNTRANIEFYESLLKNGSDGAPQSADNKPATAGNYEALCRGEGKIPPEKVMEHRCYLETYGNPALFLQPVKTEVVYRNPDIFILHDFATENQMEKLKNIGKRYLQRSLVAKAETEGFEPVKYRISKSASLSDEVDPIVPELNRRIGMMTNLDIKISQDLQVANYGIGGHYIPHHDHLRTLDGINRTQTIPALGDRIATFLMYLTDVEAGGATVFPLISVTLYPQKGSAAFWYNLHRDGLGDENTLHAGKFFMAMSALSSVHHRIVGVVFHTGCPVLCGIKWISNKWIREKTQWSRPCGLQPDSPEWIEGWPKEYL